MKRRLILSAGTAGAAALPLSACGFIGGGDDEGDAKTIKFWLSGDANQGGGFQKMADKYHEETGITVDIDDIPYDDFNTRLRNAAQADGLPDLARVTAIDPIWMNQLEDLSDVASEHGVMENLLTENEDGEIPTFLTDLTAVGLYVNKTLFDEAGVSYPTTPEGLWTWDQFIAAVKEVKAATGCRYGLVMDPSSHRLRSFMYQFGSDGFTLGEDCTYSTDEATTTEALQFFADINDDDVMPKSVWVSGDDPNALFKSGQVAAYYSGSWQVADFQANIADFEWASALMPAQPRRATNLGGGYIVVFKGDKSQESARLRQLALHRGELHRDLRDLRIPAGDPGARHRLRRLADELRPVQRGDRRIRPDLLRPGTGRLGGRVRGADRRRRRRPAQGRGRQARRRRAGRGHDHREHHCRTQREHRLRVTLDGHRHRFQTPYRAAQAAR